MSVDRWNCTSYCLCESRKGHFEKASDDGVWVLYTDHQTEIERLRAALADLRSGIEEYATDTVWYSPIETACDRITAILDECSHPPQLGEHTK